MDCTDRPELQPAKPTKLCPRQNGYFAHENPEVNIPLWSWTVLSEQLWVVPNDLCGPG